MTPQGPLYYLGNSRSQGQTEDMITKEAKGLCIFCPEHLRADPSQRVAHESGHWIVTPNQYPYAGVLHHFLLVPKVHVTDVLDLSPAAFADMQRALSWVRKTYGLTYWSFGSRNGDFRYTGATIAHVHIHVLVGDPAQHDESPVILYLSSCPGE
jgi:ATP adenylyltransferase